MKFTYAAATMGYGNGYFWHQAFNFPSFQITTKTITLNPIIGFPFAIIHLGRSVWNHVGLHNPGIFTWLSKYYNPNVILSLSGSDDEIQKMCDILGGIKLSGIELNYSCPNVKSNRNLKIPNTEHKLQLKLNYLQDPFKYDLTRIIKICVNSVPKFYGGVSGRLAQRNNWKFIEQFNKAGLNIAGSSINTFSDIKRLEDIGCKEISLGSILLINPWLVQGLTEG